MNIPKKPIPPPSRTLRETLFGGLVETPESKRRTQAWQDGKCKGCTYGDKPCSCNNLENTQ